ncbi:class I SAM-dependent methyltransferase [bacterium]|nr:class I SAM-dependent methyltransferase [Akkermansiaceae bacterium]MDB4745252.1 class I SAM-dependent methyltransferase [bacterium]
MSEVYESGRYVGEYLLFHFGSAEEILPWPGGPAEALDFPVRTVGHFSKGRVKRALDVGCAVGRSTLEMSRSADEVIGIDFSKAFVATAEKVRKGERVRYERLEEAGEVASLEVRIPEGVSPGKVGFEVGDAMGLREDLGAFDRVHAANLVCRLPEPRRFLSRLSALVKPGGELVLATPCTWLEEFTSKENWPSGSTAEWLERELGEEFKLVGKADEPFLIRETARKFQWTVSMVTKWVRR